MKKIEEILKNRKNVSFFREDKIPDKKIIENLLEKTHNLTPHKNNFWHYEIEVYGPEHIEEKRYTAISTVCSDGRDEFIGSNSPKKYEKLEKIYDEWLYFHNNNEKTPEWIERHKEFKKKYGKIHFNNQVTAPYLFVYTKKDKLLTDTQLKSDYYKKGRLEQVFDVNYQTKSDMWLIQSGMHSIILSALAVEQGLDASFCKCYFYNHHIHTNILRKAKRRPGDIAFLLGLGYGDKEKHNYQSYVEKPLLDEIIKWR